MNKASKLWVIIACLSAIGSIFYIQQIIGVHSFDPYYSNSNATFARISLFITSLSISACFSQAFADNIESTTGKFQGLLYLIVDVAISLYYMFKINDTLLYILVIATPICISIGVKTLTKGKKPHNKSTMLFLLIIMLLAATPFVTMNLFDIERHSRYRDYLIYHGATGIYVIIASIIGSISMIYLTEKHRDKERLFDPEEFISTLTKLSALFDADMITQEELGKQKKELIYEFSLTSLKMNPLEFLAELAPLKQKGILTDEDIVNIKKVI
ncbi:hypothetical protein [Providencia sp. PROV039]|uniref:hypothetical protein n=1 Tax=Providencia sp. PROV039 TaxID=2949770 RepID=UPI00234B041F|nr:hypothetical protein [Providencia sp. PROV039]